MKRFLMLQTFFTDEHEIFRKSFRDFVEQRARPLHRRVGARRDLPARGLQAHGRARLPRRLAIPRSSAAAAATTGTTSSTARSSSVPARRASTCRSWCRPTWRRRSSTPSARASRRKSSWCPAIRGEKIAALGVSRAQRGSDVAVDPHHRAARRRRLRRQRREDAASPTARAPTSSRWRCAPAARATAASRWSSSRPTRRASRSPRKLKKIGNHASDTAELSFEDCRIPARYLLGEENQGFYYIMMNFQGERLIAAVSAVAGGAARARRGHRVRARAQGLRAARRRASRSGATARRAPHRDRGGALAHLPRLRSLQPQAGRGQGDHHGQALLRRAGLQQASSTAACSSTAASATWTSSRSRAIWRDTRLITIGGGTSEIMKEIISEAHRAGVAGTALADVSVTWKHAFSGLMPSKIEWTDETWNPVRGARRFHRVANTATRRHSQSGFAEPSCPAENRTHSFPGSTHASIRAAWPAIGLADAPPGVRQQHERSLRRVRAGRLSRESVRC